MELSPCFKYKDFRLINVVYQEFFKEIYLKNYSCKECSEYCILEILEQNDGFYYICPSGYIETEQKIPSDQLKRYEFKCKNFLQKICTINSISFYTTGINNKAVLFGEKEVNKINYKFFYINQLFSQNKLNENIIYQIKEYYQSTERAVIITPQSFMLSNSNKAFLNYNNCQIFSLKQLLLNNLVINQIGTSSNIDINCLIETHELVFLNSSDVYLYKKRLSLSPMAFNLFKIIALKGKEDLSISYDDCIDYLWQDEKFDKKDFSKQLQNHRSDINKACQHADIEENIYKKLIKAQNKSYKLIIDPEKIFIL